MENITYTNALIALVGFLAWVIIVFRIDKDLVDDSEKEFSFRDYAKKNYDNWLTSLIGVPVVLVGADLLDIVKVFHDTELTWSNAFYLGAGVVTEVPMYFIKKWRKQKQQS